MAHAQQGPITSLSAVMRRMLLVGMGMLLVVGCADRAQDPAQGALPTVRVTVGTQTFTLEVANTDATRQRGLMFRESMPADHGMLFVFDRPNPRSFWMRNTLIPLDILFLDENGRVLNIEPMRPLDEQTNTRSFGAAQYAIELNQGAAERAGVRAGDRIDLPPLPAGAAGER